MRSGSKLLSSGNVITWTEVQLGDRGSIAASFDSQPSEQDLAETRVYLQSLAPAGTTTATGTFKGKDVGRHIAGHLTRQAANN